MAHAIRDESQRQRALNVAVRQKRKAMDAVAPFQAKLAALHSRAALVMILRTRMPSSPQTRQELDALAEEVRADRVQFAMCAATLPVEIASHDRVVDVRRSLERLLMTLEATGQG